MQSLALNVEFTGQLPCCRVTDRLDLPGFRLSARSTPARGTGHPAQSAGLIELSAGCPDKLSEQSDDHRNRPRTAGRHISTCQRTGSYLVNSRPEITRCHSEPLAPGSGFPAKSILQLDRAVSAVRCRARHGVC